MKIRWTLQNRILVPSAALILLIAAGTSATSFLLSRSTVKTILLAQMKQLCESSIDQVDNWIDGQRKNILQWAIEPRVLATLKTSAEAQSSAKVVSSQLEHAKQLYGFYEDLHLANSTGATVASSNPGSVGSLNVADRTYFKEAMAGKVAISEVLKSRTTGKPIVVIATPIKEGQTIHGVLYGVLDLNWFSSRFISNIKVLETGYAYLFDEKGVFIAHPNAAKILQTKIADYDWGTKIQGVSAGELEYAFEGVKKVASWRTSQLSHWGMVITAPSKELEAPAYRVGKLILALGLAVLALGVVTMLLTVRTVSRAIHQIAGDLAQGAEQTTAAAGQVSASSQSLAEGASEQAASLEETSASLEEMSSMTKRTTDNAQAAKGLSNQTRAAAESGASDMQAMSEAMTAIKGSSDNIAKIIKTIDEIAFQTNILALNAAVEAARAGEAGMGFAVVADEVRALAQRCAQAARETTEKIEDSIARSERGVHINERVARSLAEIVEKARKVDELITEIAAASKEQNQGIEQLNTAVTQMDRVTQANAAGAEESASAAQELNTQANVLKQAVAGLARLVTGSDSSSAGAANPPSDLTPTVRHARRPVTQPTSALLPTGRNGNGHPTPQEAFEDFEPLATHNRARG